MTTIEQLAARVRTLGGQIWLKRSLATYSALGIGGAAEALVVAEGREALLTAIREALALGVPWRVFGGLTNLLLPDAGVSGLVILNRAGAVEWRADGRVTVESGAMVVPVAREAVRRGWAGLTWAVGLPGTMGGAAINNAGAFGGEMAERLVEVEVLLSDGTVQQVEPAWMEFHYRGSRLKGAPAEGVVLSVTFQLEPGDPEHLAQKAGEYMERRRKTQPPGKTLGSTFKNPPGDYAGRLIDAACLKGCKVGGMVISPLHGNFFINEGGGTAADFLALVHLVQGTVEQKFGVRLEPEIEIVASFDAAAAQILNHKE